MSEDNPKIDEKIILDDPRTIYSLAMTAILFEIYNSGILKSQDTLMEGLNDIILILLGGQLFFLFLRGVSLAEIKAENREKILGASDTVYTYIFQVSTIVLFTLFFLSDADKIFNYLGVPKNLFYRFLYFLIFLISVAVGMYIWKKIFITTKTGKPIYIAMILWAIVAFFIIMFH